MNDCTITLSIASVETLPKYVEILCWNVSFENKRHAGPGGDYDSQSLAVGS